MSEIIVIAEGGINHQGDVETAKRLIDAALFAGCSAIKFQKRDPDLCVPVSQRAVPKDTPWGRMSYIEYKHRMEFGQAEWDVLHRYAEERFLPLFFSVWDEPSLAFALSYPGEYVKIPSALLTDYHLVRKAAGSGRHVILSTGMSTLDEVKTAATILRQNATDYTLMHCHSAYPAPRHEINLRVIETLRDTFQCKVGYSAHQVGTTATVWALAYGATMLEQHITLDRASWGSDHESSIEPLEFARLVSHVHSFQAAAGDGVKRVWESEMAARRRLRPQTEAA